MAVIQTADCGHSTRPLPADEPVRLAFPGGFRFDFARLKLKSRVPARCERHVLEPDPLIERPGLKFEPIDIGDSQAEFHGHLAKCHGHSKGESDWLMLRPVLCDCDHARLLVDQ